jgi:hypothetical protein
MQEYDPSTYIMIGAVRSIGWVYASFFLRKRSIGLLILIISSTKNIKIIINTNRSLDYIATTTSTRASQRCTTILTPPSLKSDKVCYSRDFNSTQTKNRRAKVPKDQRTRATTIAREGNWAATTPPTEMKIDKVPEDPPNTQLYTPPLMLGDTSPTYL